MRTRAWHAAALLRLSQGDRRGANAAVAAGLRALEQHRLTLGATELRAHASGHGEELATLGLRLALESGSAARVLAAAERRRAAGLLLRPARPPDDAALAAELAELRRVTADLDESLRDGRPEPALIRRQAQLEAPSAAAPCARRRTARQRPTRARRRTPPPERRADDRATPRGAPRVAALADALGERVLVEFFALDGRLHAVTVADGRAAHHALGAEADVNREVSSLRFSLRRVATAPPGSRTAEAMADVCATVAERLDALLLAPLELAQRPLVIVPTGELHALPWSMLPSLRAHARHRRAVAAAVAPRRRRAAARRRRAVLVAGPRLPAATRRDRDAHRAPPATRPRSPATKRPSQNVSEALDGADSAHVAAHGRFRDDNPQFCSLELADGALTVYDLERLKRAPRRLVLSSCESGLSAVHAGDELMGFTAAVFALGTRR